MTESYKCRLSIESDQCLSIKCPPTKCLSAYGLLAKCLPIKCLSAKWNSTRRHVAFQMVNGGSHMAVPTVVNGSANSAVLTKLRFNCTLLDFCSQINDAMTFNITSPSLTTLSTVDLIETRNINDNQRYVNQTTDIMLNFVMTLLSVVMLSVVVSNQYCL